MTASWQVRDYINGKWRAVAPGGALEVADPATGETLARLPEGGTPELEAAVQAAAAAFPEWRSIPPEDRIQYLFRFKQKLEEHFEEIARLITRENGKTLAESRGGVAAGNRERGGGLRDSDPDAGLQPGERRQRH